MPEPIRILLIEDSAEDAELQSRELRRGGLEAVTERVHERVGLDAALAWWSPDLILSDYSLPGFNGLEALKIARMLSPDTPFIFVSGTIGEERAIEALKLGATDYVIKDNRARLVPAIRRALQETAERLARRHAERERNASEMRFRVFMDHLPAAAFMKDLEGRFIYVNPEFERVVGRTADEIIGRRVEELYAVDVAVDLFHNDEVALAASEGIEAIEQAPMHDGLHFFLTRKFATRDSDAETVLLGGIALDITERVRQQEKIARLSRIHAVLSGINSAIVRIRDPQDLFRETCRIAVEFGHFRLAWVGLATGADEGVRPAAWIDADGGPPEASAARLREVFAEPGTAALALSGNGLVTANDIAAQPQVVFKQAALARGYRSSIALPLLVEGKPIAALVLYASEVDFFDRDEIELLEELAGDISYALEHIAKADRLAYLSFYDPVTGLANRQLFFDRLTQALHTVGGERRGLSVLVLDLQRFRTINDTLGRSRGDQILKEFAQRLTQTCGEATMLARIGGDRFAAVVPDLRGPALAHFIEEGIVQALVEPFVIGDLDLRIAVNIGIAQFPADGASGESLFRNAEAALQRAKETADTYVFYAPELNPQVAVRLHFENRLRKAVEKQEFVLYYQPKMDLATRSIRGLEALVRWQDPSNGLVSPLAFIGLLEETGMIIPVGRWVIEQAVHEMQAWRAQGLDVPRIAVNVSQVQLRQRDFVATVLGALAELGGHSPGFDLEITESLVMEDLEAKIEKLSELRNHGIRVVLDDFGTGYSSLSQIARLPLDALKIDRAFIANMMQKNEDMAIVSAIISLARVMNLEVIAEGVETETQAERLQSLHCDQAQGWLFSAPLPASEVVGLLRGATTRA